MSDPTSVEAETRKDLVVIHWAPDAPEPSGIDDDSDLRTVAVGAASPFGWHEFATTLSDWRDSAPPLRIQRFTRISAITAEAIATHVAKLLGKE